MAAKMIIFMSALVLVLVGFQTAESQCVCPTVHPQTAFCSADFVLRGSPVASVVSNNVTRIYTIRLYDVLKATRPIRSILRARRLYTNADPLQCGSNLTLYRNYILSGSIVNGTAVINQCGINVPNPYGRQTQYFESFLGSCACAIDTCATNTTTCTKVNTNCIYDAQYTNGPACYAKYGICRPRRGVCNWTRNDRGRTLNRCLSTVLTTIPVGL